MRSEISTVGSATFALCEIGHATGEHRMIAGLIHPAKHAASRTIVDKTQGRSLTNPLTNRPSRPENDERPGTDCGPDQGFLWWRGQDLNL